jgi:hypothetical protein
MQKCGTALHMFRFASFAVGATFSFVQQFFLNTTKKVCVGPTTLHGGASGDASGLLRVVASSNLQQLVATKFLCPASRLMGLSSSGTLGLRGQALPKGRQNAVSPLPWGDLQI